jgi:hypothetical protein
MWLAMLESKPDKGDEVLRIWSMSEERGAARPLAAAIAGLSLGQTEFLPAWYEQHSTAVDISDRRLDARWLTAGVMTPAQREPALKWLRSALDAASPAFLITQYAMLGDAGDAIRIASNHRIRNTVRITVNRSCLAPIDGAEAFSSTNITRLSRRGESSGRLSIDVDGDPQVDQPSAQPKRYP